MRPARGPALGRPSRTLGGIVLGLLVCLAPELGAAQYIGPGREAEVQALFAPHALGDEVAPGRVLVRLRIEPTSIHVGLAPTADDAPDGWVELQRPDGRARDVPSFVVAGDDPARAAIVRAVQRNDDGTFWADAVTPSTGRVQQRVLPEWGLGLLALLFLLVVARAARGSGPGSGAGSGAGRWLIGITLAAAMVRWAMAPRALLGVWAWTRTTDVQAAMLDGSVLPWLSTYGAFTELQVLSALGFAFAALTPLAVFAHARLLLGRPDRALWAAAIVAAMPLHVRFSASEVAFVPSLLLSSLAFATMHLALKDPSRIVRAALLLALPFVVFVVLHARPLNVLFVALMVVWIVAARPEAASVPPTRARAARWVAALSIVGVGALVTVGHLLTRYGENVREGLSFRTLTDGLTGLLDPGVNTLLDVRCTPPVLLLLLLALGWAAWRGAPVERLERLRRRYLVAWWFAFFVTHAYVLPENPLNQARYHLHLVVPLAMMAALGLEVLWRARARAPRVAVWVAAAWLGVAPCMHAGFVTDVSPNELREVGFVQRAAQQVPEGCTVVEVASEAEGARFARAARVFRGGERGTRFQNVRVPPDAANAGAAPSLPACVYLYMGLPCATMAGADRAATCASLLRARRWELVLEDRFGHAPFDRRANDADLRPGHPLRLELYRAAPPVSEGARDRRSPR